MIKRAIPFALVLLLSSAVGLATEVPPQTPQPDQPAPLPGRIERQQPVPPGQDAERIGNIRTAVAVLLPTEGNQVNGTIYFREQGDQVHVTGDVYGLQPNSVHGFHIHQWGDLSSPDAEAAGDHYNPEDHQHALPKEQPRHAGDLGNLQADAQGHATVDVTVDNVTISGSENPILGRSLIVHAKPDTGAQPSGEAGPRLAQAVIGVANPEQAETQATRARPVR